LRSATSRGVHWWVNISLPRCPFLELPNVIRDVRRNVGGWGLRGLIGTVLAMLVYRRLNRIVVQLERLIARYQAGTLRTAGPRGPVSERVALEAVGRARVAVDVMWPRRFGWLVRAVGWQAAGYGGQLETVLHMPEMVEMLRASPQAIRILRPVCRMLHVDPRYLQPGMVVGYVPPVERVVKKRVRKPRAKVDWGRIPLPRGMLAAAKRQGFGKVPRG